MMIVTVLKCAYTQTQIEQSVVLCEKNFEREYFGACGLIDLSGIYTTNIYV